MHQMEDILLEAHRAGIRLFSDGGSLRYEGPLGTSGTELLDRIRAHKADFIAYFDGIKTAFHPPYPQTGLSIQQKCRDMGSLTSGRSNGVLALLSSKPLELDCLKETLATVVQKHGSLRTRYHLSSTKEFRGIVEESASPGLEVQKLSADDSQITNPSTLALASSWAYRDLDLGSSCHLKALLIQGKCESLLVLAVPHFTSDQFSTQILFDDIRRYYRMCRDRIEIDRLPSTSNYDIYVRSQGNALMSGEWLLEKEYWRNRYKNFSKIEIPGEYRGTSHDSSSDSEPLFHISKSELESLMLIAREEQCAPESLIVAIIAVAVAKWSRQQKFVMQTAYRGRGTVNEHATIGMFVLSLFHAVEFDGHLTFRQFLRDTFNNWKSMTNKGGLPAHLGFTEAFDILEAVPLVTNLLLHFQSGPADAESVSVAAQAQTGACFQYLALPTQSYKASFKFMSLFVIGNLDGVSGRLRYNRALITKAGAIALQVAFQTALSGILGENGNGIFSEVK